MRNLSISSLLIALSLCAPFSLEGHETRKADSTKIANQFQPSAEISELNRQIDEIARHIKCKPDTFYLDITLEQAKDRGVSEEVYNMWIKRLKVYTQEAKEAISNGSHFTFEYYPSLSQEEKDFRKLLWYIKISGDSCYLSISQEEALQQGFSEKAYRRCAVRAKRHQAFRGALPINNGDSAEISDRNRPTPQIKEWHRQEAEVAKHLKYKNGTYYLDITLEEAQKRGIDEDLYYMWLYRIDDLNKKSAPPQP